MKMYLTEDERYPVYNLSEESSFDEGESVEITQEDTIIPIQFEWEEVQNWLKTYKLKEYLENALHEEIKKTLKEPTGTIDSKKLFE